MTKLSPNHTNARKIQGFATHLTGNGEVELFVMPELGAKITSLKNLRTRREWLWHPTEPMKLFQNSPRVDFSASPLAGIDKCLPTISQPVENTAAHGAVAWNLSLHIGKVK